MGSISDVIDCPDCGSEANDELYYKTGEEYINCSSCGYSRKFYITNLEDEKKPNEEGFEWIPEYKIEEVHGCGAYRLKPKGYLGYEVGGFTEPAAEQEFIRLVEERKSEIEHAEYTTFVDGVLKKTVLIEGDLYGEANPINEE